MYTVSAAINQVKTVSVSLTPSFQLDIPAIQAAITPQSRMLFICSPNNPTGNLIDRRDILSLVAQFPGLVVVDEAYIDFANDPGFLPVLEDHPNLIILQTLSKAWGMAGLRLGMAFAHPAIIRILNKIKPPYNISLPTQEIALANLQRADLKQALLETMLQERAQLLEALAKIPCIQHIFPTDANFVLISTAEPKKLYHYLIQQQIIVRDRSTVPLCEGCLRISVGTSEENIVLIKALETYSSLP
jgi:histidinol-phosphate aminotransferase